MEPTTPRKQQTITYQLLAANEQRTMTTFGNNNKNNPHATINYSLSPNPVHETVPVNDNKKQQRHAATAATTCDKTASVDNDSDNNNMRLQPQEQHTQQSTPRFCPTAKQSATTAWQQHHSAASDNTVRVEEGVDAVNESTLSNLDTLTGW